MNASWNTIMRATISALVVLLSVAALHVAVARGQAGTTAILGTVTDASGGVIAGARIEVKNVGTGVGQSALTDSQGRYNVPELPIGDYQVQATMSGFERAVRGGITLTIGSHTVIDFTLKVGQTESSVTVEGAVSQVETTSSALSSLVEPTQVRELPLNGRNFEQLMTLEPGVTSVAAGNSFYGTENNYSVAGARPEGQAYLLDGSNIVGFWNHGTGSGATGESLGIEAIAEFQTLTNTYSAQFGGNGAVVNAVTKSGTNSFHGSGYEFLRNSALDARNFFDGPKIPPLRRNQFGASVGGPIKKNKAFFFVNYEGLRWLLGSSAVAIVPDANMHSGYLPCSSAPDKTCNTSTGLANVGVASNVASTLALYPVATTPLGDGSGTITEVANQTTSENYFVGRFDLTLSSKDSFFMRYVRDTASQVLPYSSSNVPLWPETDTTANHFATIEEKHLFSPNLINLARFSFNRPNDSALVTAQTTPLLYFPGRPDGQVVPGTLTAIGANVLLPFALPENKFTYADDILWTHGSHSLAMGLAVTRIQSNTVAPFLYGGQWTFPSLEAFLEGNASLLTGALPGQADATKDFRELFVAPYINDDWKVTSKLTINLGLRYDWETNPLEIHHGMEALLSSPNGNFVPVTHAFAKNPSNKNFEPRVGIAYDLFGDHKTALRAGFGLFDDPVLPRLYDPGYWLNPPYTIGVQLPPSLNYPNAFVGSGVGAAQISQVQGIDYQFSHTPYEIQYNFNIQREIGANTVLTIGYVGSTGVHLVTNVDRNPPGQNGKPWINDGTIAALNDPTQCDQTNKPSPDGQQIFGCLNPAGPGTPAGITVVPLPRQNPTYSGLYEKEPWGHSHYHSLQTSLNHRFHQDFQAQVSYTYSKSIDVGSVTYGLEQNQFISLNQSPTNPYDLSVDKGRSDFDQTHNLTASGVFALPFHKTQLVQGWQFSGILSASSGFPYPILTGYGGNGFSSLNERPDLLAGSSPSPKITGNPNGWWSSSGFALPPAGEIGNLGRNTAIGPDLINLDFGVMKDTLIPKEQVHLQFRAEFFNILNHTNFGAPNPNLFISSGPDGAVSVSPTFGQIINTATTSRQIQFALKLIF